MQFELYTPPRIVFGAGSIGQLPELVAQHGRQALLVVGGRSAERSGLLARLERLLPLGAVVRCAREPRVEDVDAAVEQARLARCDVVVAVGGGSVLDCGKATAGLLTNPGALLDYLEGVGDTKTIDRPAAPLIAVPTTAGTGSEATKNAVISGDGFKKSVRSALLVPRVALIDPELTHGVPPAVTAACGMDALTQLIEAYLSRSASVVTDALALQGVRAAGRGLVPAYEQPASAGARQDMALASLLGGICLANAGLGAVHGFASPLGALFPIPHGVACATLLPHVLRANLAASRHTELEQRVWSRVADIGEAFTGQRYSSRGAAVDACLAAVESLHRQLQIPGLTALGVTRADIPRIVAGSRGSSMRYNPVELTDQELAVVLEAAM